MKPWLQRMKPEMEIRYGVRKIACLKSQVLERLIKVMIHFGKIVQCFRSRHALNSHARGGYTSKIASQATCRSGTHLCKQHESPGSTARESFDLGEFKDFEGLGFTVLGGFKVLEGLGLGFF